MSFDDWFKAWLAGHPLKSPTARDPSRFTAQVMARVRAGTQPAQTPARLLGLWRGLAVPLAVAAGLLVAVTLRSPGRSEGRLAARLTDEAELLAELGEPMGGSLSSGDVNALAEELEHQDALVLAEAPPDDDTWIAQTLQLLDQVDQELPDDASTGSSDEQWMQELQTLDDSELAARS